MRFWSIALAGVALGALAQTGARERGLEAFRRKDFQAAEREFRKMVAAQPESPLGWKLLGMVYTAQDDYKKAEEPFARACALNPREENACYYLGRVYYSLSRFEKARGAFEIALQNREGRGRAAAGMALTLTALGRLREAEDFYKEAVRLGEKQAAVDYGLFLARNGRGKEALEVLSQAGATADLERVRKELAAAPAAGPGIAPAAVRFESDELDMVVRNGATGEKHLIETMLSGAAVFDYDGDGWPDIFISNGAEIPSLRKTGPEFYNRLFRNNHDGSFTDVTNRAGVAGSGYSMGVAAADYDNDGHVDLFVTGVRGNTLYRNRGDGTFEDVTGKAGVVGNGTWSVAAGWFDYDNDGLLDLFVVRYVAWDPAREAYCGLARPGYRTYCHPRLYEPLPNALYHNEGDGTFRDVSAESGIGAHAGKGMGIAFGDYDGDGLLDVFVGNDTVPNFLFHNEGRGLFREAALSAGVAYNDDGQAISSMGVDFRDYDNDGREDLFIAALTNETFPLFRNVGRGSFVDVSAPSLLARATLPWSGWSTGMFDLNNDGYKDLFTANGNVMDNAELTSSRTSRQPNTVFLNRANGTFEAQNLPGEAFHRAAAFGDFDRDGRIDVVVTRLNEKPVVLFNRTAPAGHWIALRLTGSRSNRDAIGARVHLVTATGEQWNRVTTSSGYGCSSEPAVHFGLGTEATVKRIDIEWPSGGKQELTAVEADRYLEVRER